MSTINWEYDIWHLINRIFKDKDFKNIIYHQISSYNYFVEKLLPQIVKQYNPIVLNYNINDEPENDIYTHTVIINFGDTYLTNAIIHENNGSTKLMYPNEARLRNFTYASSLLVDLIITTIERNGKELKKNTCVINKVSLGKIPIMLQSNSCVLKTFERSLKNMDECENDLGGYFIINGSEKVIVSQERTAENRVYIFKSNRHTKYKAIAEIKSVSLKAFNIIRGVQVKLTSRNDRGGGTIKIAIPHIKQDIPIFIIFRALGIESDKDILEYILIDLNTDEAPIIMSIMKDSLEEASGIQTRQLAIEYIAKYINNTYMIKDKFNKDKKVKYVKDILLKEYLPHLGESFIKKSYFTGYMIRKLILVYLGKINYDDRDSYINKRIDTPGILLGNLFKMLFSKLVKDMKNAVHKEFNNGSWKATKDFSKCVTKSNIYKIIKSSIITTGMKFALATGNWGAQKLSNKQGIAQVLSRLSYNSTLSHLRRVNTPIEKTGKLIAPRKLHPTQWGVMCPAETPEGGSIGVVKNLALSCLITNYSNEFPVKKFLKQLGLQMLEELRPSDIKNKTKVFINGDWYGIINNPKKISQTLLEYRREGLLDYTISISWDIINDTININSEAGRCIRPLLIIENNKYLLQKKHLDLLKNNSIDWKDLISSMLLSSKIPDSKAIMEFLDVEEVNTKMIAINHHKLQENESENRVIRILYTHAEIHSSLILGILASTIPFCHHNQSPRNTYQSAMGKQAMGIYAMNYLKRLDTLAHVLYYPQKPIVNSKLAQLLPSNNMPCGINVVIAIASHSGYNQEDSIIVNRSAVERGLFMSTFYRTYKDDEKRSHASGEDERFCKPDSKNTKGLKYGNYNKVEEDGFVKNNTRVVGNDVIIGKIIPLRDSENKSDKARDNSTLLRSNETGYIDNVYVSRNSDGYRFCKVRVRSERIPNIGDKLSSRHGQKGTIGMVYKHEDMPFTKDGIVPDLIINPHAIPSRMTVGQLIECITGKISTNLGVYGDATPFNNVKVSQIANILQNQCNFAKYGNEVLYNGRTGEQLQAHVFIGPTFYQRLKHMVKDKIHSRSNGPTVILTRQPSEGRARDGGLRFGEMERDCMIAHGTSSFLKETLLERSDNYRVFTCKKCGGIASVNPEKNIYYCKACNNYCDFSEVRIPYACKLFLQELETMSISPKFITDKLR